MPALEVVHGEKADHQSDHNTKRNFHLKNLSLRSCVERRFDRASLLVNLRRAGQRFLQLLQSEVGTAGDAKNRLLAAGAQFCSFGQFGRNIDGDHNGSMLVGMNKIARSDCHAVNTDVVTETVEMNVGVGWVEHACEGLESRSPLRDVTDRSVSDHAEAAKRLMDRAVDLAPECSEADVGAVQILDHVDPWAGAGAGSIHNTPAAARAGQRATGWMLMSRELLRYGRSRPSEAGPEMGKRKACS